MLNTCFFAAFYGPLKNELTMLKTAEKINLF